MATMDLVKYYGGEPANFLDIGGSSNPDKVVNALKIITADPSVPRHPLQHLRRHHPLRRRRQRHQPPSRSPRCKVPIVVRLTGTNEKEARKILQGIGMTALSDMDEAVSTGDQAGRGGGVSILIDKDTRLVVQGITGRDGSFHTKQMIEYGTKVVAGVTPGKGGQRFESTVPVFDTVAEAVARGRRQHLGHLRAAGRRRRRHLRGGRRRHHAGRVHHRGRAGARDDPGHALRAGARARGSSGPTARAPSRRARPRSASSRARSARRAGRAGVAQRHAHLRGGPPAHPGQDRAEHLRRASAATPSSAPTSSTACAPSRPIPTPTRS